MKGISQIKPRYGQDRVCLRWNIKLPMSLPINKPIVKLTKNPIPLTLNMEQPKTNFKSFNTAKF